MIYRTFCQLANKEAVSVQYAITALGLLVCRHGIILRASNCFTGERHAYALVFIRWLVCVLGLAVSYVW